MGPVERLLTNAFERIRDEKRWCRRDFARNASGRGVSPCSREARQWCSHGALYREGSSRAVADEVECEAFLTLNRACQEFADGRLSVEVNDRLGHMPMLCMFKTAIADAKARGI